MKVRGWLLQYFGNNKAEFECVNGHRFRGPVIPNKPKNVGEMGIGVLVSWWTKEKGGVNLTCAQCDREKDVT